MDVRRIQIKNKISFDGLRHHFVPPSRPKSSSTSSQYTLVSQQSSSLSSPKWHSSFVTREAQLPELSDHETLLEIDPRTGEYCDMSFSKSIKSKHFKGLLGHRSSVSKDHHSHQIHQHQQHQQHQSSPNGYLESNPKNNEYLLNDSANAYGGDANGEPLIDDTNPDYIPKSARPLVSKFTEISVVSEPLSQPPPPQAQAQAQVQAKALAPAPAKRASSPTIPLQHIHQLQLQSHPSPKTQNYQHDSPHSARSRSSSPFRQPISKHISDHRDPLALDASGDPSLNQRIDSPQAKTDAAQHQSVKAPVVSAMSDSTAPSRRPPSSSIESIMSTETEQTSHAGLVPLQARAQNEDIDKLQPVLEDDPASFNLVSAAGEAAKTFSLERRSEEMLSTAHLEEIFADPSTLLKFTRFLSQHRPQSIPLLIYYLDAKKSIKAVKYANAVLESLAPLPGLNFTTHTIPQTSNAILEQRAKDAFTILVQEDLPAYVAHVFIHIVNLSLRCRVTGTMPVHLREASEGLAEVFCLTDPSRKDNPIVFTSEEFHRTTQYGVDYAIGRNCRFLQGPVTNRNSVRRLREACEAGKECVEVFLNYRRDGSPFMNLLMVAPLIDSRGAVRYFIGAQVDVTGLCKDATDLDGLRRLIEKRKRALEDGEPEANGVVEKTSSDKSPSSLIDLQELSEMFNEAEIDAVRRHGGRMHPDKVEEDESIIHHRPRLHVRDPSTEDKPDEDVPEHYGSPTRGRLLHVYQNYLLVRPAPSLRILFASPALRTPGMLQSPFLSRIGGSQRVREELQAALSQGRGVTAKIRWVSGRSADEDGRTRWVHCTPLLGANGTVGVWMVVIVDEEGYAPVKRFKTAPPVSASISGIKDRDARRNSSRYTSLNGSLESLGLGTGSMNGVASADEYAAQADAATRSGSRAMSHKLELEDM